MKTFTLDDVLAAADLLDRAATNPSYEDPIHADEVARCRYVEPDGSPSCIAGTILWNLDNHLMQTIVDEGLNYDTNVTELAIFLQGDGKAKFTAEAVSWLMRAQSQADNGLTWGAARDFANLFTDAVSQYVLDARDGSI